MKILIVLIVTALYGQAVHAEIYRSVDENGKITYSDMPTQNAEEVQLPGLTIYSSSPVKNTIKTDSKPVEKTERYTTFKINEPGDDGTIRENSGRVAVNLQLDPELYNGDVIVYDMDGQIYKQRTTNLILTEMDRGTHILKVHIIDAQGKKVSPVITSQFHLLRVSVLFRAR